MPQPFDYSVPVPDPTQMMNNAVGLKQNILQLKAGQMQMDAAKASIAQTQQMNADLAAVHKNPTPASIAQLSIKYPQLSENLKRSYDMLGSEQKQAKTDMASQAYASLLAGDNDTAANLLTSYAEAYKNSGMTQDADAATNMAALIKAHPETAKTTAGLFLANAMGPDKFTENFSKLEAERRNTDLEPSTLSKAQSDARTAATTAKFADSNAAIDLQKKGWDIYKIQEDVKIARENNRVAAMTAAAAKETNDLKRQELQDKLKDAQMARDQTVRDRATAIETSRGTIDNSLSTFDRLLNNPALDDIVGSVQGGMAGEVVNTLNPVKWNSDERANAQADLDTIKSQTFLTQLQQLKNASASGASGLGALSEKEGDRLINGIQSLATKQGEKQFRDNAGEMRRLLLKARKSITEKYGVPDTIPDTPNVQTSPEDIDALVKKYSTPTGATGTY
jgi:hypothetical protein